MLHAPFLSGGCGGNRLLSTLHCKLSAAAACENYRYSRAEAAAAPSIAAAVAAAAAALHSNCHPMQACGCSTRAGGTGRRCWTFLAAVVDRMCWLPAPTAAGMRVLNPGWRHWPSALDIFPNFRLVPKIKCPVLIMHVREPAAFLLCLFAGLAAAFLVCQAGAQDRVPSAHHARESSPLV